MRFTVESGGVRARAVAFGTGGHLPLPDGEHDTDSVRATFTLEVNEWNGVSEPRLVLRRVQPATIAARDERERERHAPVEGELVLFALP